MERMAAGGWIFERLKYGWFFTFHKAPAQKTVYSFEMKGYIPASAITEMGEKGWLMYRAGKTWMIWAKNYSGKRPLEVRKQGK